MLEIRSVLFCGLNCSVFLQEPGFVNQLGSAQNLSSILCTGSIYVLKIKSRLQRQLHQKDNLKTPQELLDDTIVEEGGKTKGVIPFRSMADAGTWTKRPLPRNAGLQFTHCDDAHLLFPNVLQRKF